jgi:hypothetical protein
MVVASCVKDKNMRQKAKYDIIILWLIVIQLNCLAKREEQKMSHSKLLQQLTRTMLITLLLAGCGTPATTPVSEAPAVTSTPELSVATPTPEPPTATSTPEPPTPAPMPPKPGSWIALTEFGMWFTVDPTGTGITRIDYEFPDWKCGSTPVYIEDFTFFGELYESGKLVEGSWPISDNNEFTITNEFPIGPTILPLKTITIHGTFDETGMHAFGTWEAISRLGVNSLGETCSGTWEASPRE